MAMQNAATAAPRNQTSAANKPSKISLPAPHASTVDAGQGAAPHLPGPGVKGFSGSGTLKAKV